MIRSECGKNILEFDEEKHKYILNGEMIPGVTTLLHESMPSPIYLIAWKVKTAIDHLLEDLRLLKTPVHEYPKKKLEELVKRAKGASKKKAKEAADIGTLIHDYAEQYEANKHITKELHDAINNVKDKHLVFSCIKKFRRWYRKNKDVVLKHEEICASVIHKFGGKFDRLVARNTHVVLGDYKTSKGIYQDHLIQLGGYCIAIKEWFDIDVDVIEIIRFGKEDGEFEVKTVKSKKEIEALKEQFIRCVGTYRFMKERQ